MQRSADAARGTPPSHPASRDGDFEVFFGRHQERALRLAWLLTRSQMIAEDVTQEAMLATYARFEELDEPAAFLTRVIINTCHSSTRMITGQRRAMSNLFALERDGGSVPDPSEDMAVLDAVRRLPYRQQVVLITRYWGGWSEREIAAALECRPGTVKSLASRAMNDLRKELTR